MATYQTSISVEQQHLAPGLSPLSGWKDVANYLGKGVRTVQRYEREFGLPVRRPAGKTSGSVIAVRRELDDWVSASPLNPHRKAQPNPQRIIDLKSGVFELHRLCAEARELRAALREQRTAVQFNIARIAESVSEPGLGQAERHREVALEQKARATEMRVSAQAMKNHAIEMRKPPHRRAIVNC